ASDLNKGVIKTARENYGEQKGWREVNADGSRYPTTIIEESNANRNDRIHPTQKPVPLFEYLIKTYTNKNETVLDNCIGSGTTAIACMNTERNFIGFELDKTYYEKSLERIKNHTTQTDIFDVLEGCVDGTKQNI